MPSEISLTGDVLICEICWRSQKGNTRDNETGRAWRVRGRCSGGKGEVSSLVGEREKKGGKR